MIKCQHPLRPPRELVAEQVLLAGLRAGRAAGSWPRTRRRRRRRRVRSRPSRPRWLRRRPRRVRPLDTEQARRALVDVEACSMCRPDTDLGLL
ncbi:DUF6233 domain-containing protein [Streptomyces albidoflavus]